MKRKVGILGGTFDPIHNGHLLIAEQAYHRFELDSVLIMPSGCPPHKEQDGISNHQHREAMIQCAIADNPHFQYSDFELRRMGTIYTAETLELLKQEHPEVSYYFIMGADSLFSIESWREPEKIFQSCVVIVAGRPEEAKDTEEQCRRIQMQIAYLIEKYHAVIHFMQSPFLDISSTDIRSLVEEKQSIRYLLPEAVEQYIHEVQLYKRP